MKKESLLRNYRIGTALCTTLIAVGSLFISTSVQAQRVRLYREAVNIHDATKEQYIFERGDNVYARGDLLSSNPSWRF